jgi:AcrR family transcriptional regulator
VSPTSATTPRGRRRGPRAGGTDTQAALLAAAREEFADRGFAAATVRSIAARAHVDPAMINHYFGGKAGLFRQVTQISVDPAEGLPELLAGPRADLGRRLALHVLRIWEEPSFRDPVLAILRSAVADPEGGRLLREYLETQILPLGAAAARGDDPQRQMALAATHVFGVAMARHVIGLEPVRSLTVEQLAEQIGPTVQRYLDGTYQ